MIEPTSERGKRLAALSARLRVLHSELAEQPADMRSEQLRDEVQRAVSTMPPHEREGFLGDLMEQFPTWTGATQAAPVPPVKVVTTAAPEVKDPKILAERLIEAGKALPEHERAALARKLAAGGFSVVEVKEAVGGLPAAQIAEFKKTIGIPAEQEVSAARVIEVASLLSEFVLKLEPWACNYWRDLAPDAKNSVYQVLGKDLPKFATGDEATTKETMQKSLYKLRSLVSLLMKGVIDAGKQFARDHLARYSVDAIKEAAPRETFKSDEYRSWRQYERLMEGVDGPAIEKRLKQVIAKDVDTGLSQVIR